LFLVHLVNPTFATTNSLYNLISSFTKAVFISVRVAVMTLSSALAVAKLAMASNTYASYSISQSIFLLILLA